MSHTGTPRLAAPEVFIGGACYGFMATTYKLTYAAGYTFEQVVAAQGWVSAALFALVVLVQAACGKKWARIGWRDSAKLAGLGLITCATSTLYCFAMSVLPASVALTLLFQFTWIGIPIQMLLDHRKPTAAEVLAAVAIVVATVFASGMYRIDLAQLNVLGIVCALAAAVSCATYVTLSGRVTPACPIGQRGLLICLGTSAASLLVCPDFLPSGALVTGMAPYALMAGMFGMFLPALFFSLGTPHLSPASNTILASAELPAGLFIAMVVLAEPVTTLQWVGVGAILLAVALSQTAPRMRASRA